MEIDESESKNSELENDSLNNEDVNDEINTSRKKENNKLFLNKDFQNNIMKIESDNLLDKISNSKYTCEEKEIIFRNYIPKDKNYKVEKNNYFDLVNQKEKEMNINERKDIKNFLELEKNPLNIIPGKNNLDLKRNIAERYNILKTMTNNVIKEMIKLKIENQKK